MLGYRPITTPAQFIQMVCRLAPIAEVGQHNMGVIYLISWIVFRVLFRARGPLVFLTLGAFWNALSYAETLTGVLYSNELGNGAHPVGTIELAVGKTIHTVEYGEPLQREFKSQTCNDIGAVWSVDVVPIDDSSYAKGVTCIGRVDENVHQPYLLVRHYLEALARPGMYTNGLSQRLQFSSEFKRFVDEVGTYNLRFYFSLAHVDQCLKMTTVASSVRAQFVTHCGIELNGNYLVLCFDVVRSKPTGKWEIDGIDMK
jgi:hypothetical protein